MVNLYSSNIKMPGYVVTYQLLSPLTPNGPESTWHITQQIHSPSRRAKAQFTPHLITTYSVDTTFLTVEGEQTVAAVSDLRQTKAMGKKEITILTKISRNDIINEVMLEANNFFIYKLKIFRKNKRLIVKKLHYFHPRFSFIHLYSPLCY